MSPNITSFFSSFLPTVYADTQEPTEGTVSNVEEEQESPAEESKAEEAEEEEEEPEDVSFSVGLQNVPFFEMKECSIILPFARNARNLRNVPL